MSKNLSAAAPALVLLILIVGTISGTIVTVRSSDPPATHPAITISPETPDVDVGETFTVTIATSGLAGKNLYGFELLFVWNTAAVRYISHEAKVPVETYPEGILHDPIVEVKNEVDTSVGSCWLVFASRLPAEPFDNDGVIFIITFELVEPSSKLYELGPVVLSDKNGNEIMTTGHQDLGTPIYVPGTHKINEQWVEKWLEWWVTVTLHLQKTAIKQ